MSHSFLIVANKHMRLQMIQRIVIVNKINDYLILFETPFSNYLKDRLQATPYWIVFHNNWLIPLCFSIFNKRQIGLHFNIACYIYCSYICLRVCVCVCLRFPQWHTVMLRIARPRTWTCLPDLHANSNRQSFATFHFGKIPISKNNNCERYE